MSAVLFGYMLLMMSLMQFFCRSFSNPLLGRQKSVSETLL